MKQKQIFAVTTILLVLVGLIVITSYTVFNKDKASTENSFYVGVTYCGSSVQEAKELVDKVKNYTNLFVLQSGPLMYNIAAMEEIGDYAIASNLNYAVFSTANNNINRIWWSYVSKERWKEHFIGVYYSDEPGGKMLDGSNGIQLGNAIIQENGSSLVISIMKQSDGGVVYSGNNLYVVHYPDGRITSGKAQYEDIENGNRFTSWEIVYYPNGIITVTENVQVFSETENYYAENNYTAENITQCPHTITPYQEMLKRNPIQNYDSAAQAFVTLNREKIEYTNKPRIGEEGSFLCFTADYCLYWWDYQCGYDLVLAELGWNNTVAQEIGLVRGAANLQGKSWGTIITWKYTHAPFLTDGAEMFEQLKISYEAGAEYVVIFNYSEDPENHNTLQEEHFQALERFWNDIVQNPEVKHGDIKANAVLVLPQNYGWGMRHPDDHIWGIWRPDDVSQQIWNQLQSKLDKHGLKLDIVYEDPNHPVAGKYNNIYHWDQK